MTHWQAYSASAVMGILQPAEKEGRKGLSLSPLFLRGIVRVGMDIMMDYYNSVKGIMDLSPLPPPLGLLDRPGFRSREKV